METRTSSGNLKAVPEIKNALDSFKHESAKEMGVDLPLDGYWGDMTSRQCGAVGGNMVKRLIEIAEEQLIGPK